MKQNFILWNYLKNSDKEKQLWLTPNWILNWVNRFIVLRFIENIGTNFSMSDWALKKSCAVVGLQIKGFGEGHTMRHFTSNQVKTRHTPATPCYEQNLACWFGFKNELTHPPPKCCSSLKWQKKNISRFFAGLSLNSWFTNLPNGSKQNRKNVNCHLRITSYQKIEKDNFFLTLKTCIAQERHIQETVRRCLLQIKDRNKVAHR